MFYWWCRHSHTFAVIYMFFEKASFLYWVFLICWWNDPVSPTWIIKISSHTHTRPTHCCQEPNHCTELATHSWWKQKANLITHTHTQSPQGDLDMKRRRCLPSPSLFSLSSHQIHLEASVWLWLFSLWRQLLCLDHLINCQPGGDGLKRWEI